MSRAKNDHVLRAYVCIAGVCLTTDVDTLLFHMNNVRYLREVDFARVDFYERTKLYRKIRSKGGAVYQGATTIRYRRFVRPFSRFRITSRVRLRIKSLFSDGQDSDYLDTIQWNVQDNQFLYLT